MAYNVPFPLSSTPGLRAGEGQGRLINGYAEKEGDAVIIRRSVGLASYINALGNLPRGIIEVNGRLYIAFQEYLVTVLNGVASVVGAFPGQDGVTFARNNKVTDGASTPDVVAVRSSGGAYIITPTTIVAYNDADLPANVTSVSFQDGYFIFTVLDGRIFASDLNTTAVNALSFATAEAQPDGLLRGISYGGIFYAFGQSTIEPYRNVGAQPFPLQRGTSIIPVGIRSTMAVAGYEIGWDRDPFFVAHDGTVRRLSGYSAEPVSTPAVETFVAKSNSNLLEASVYTAKGKAFWVLTSDVGTWELNVNSGLWNERASAGGVNWRASRSVKMGDKWYVCDRLSTNLLTVSETLTTEAGAAVTWTIESGGLKDFPSRIRVPAVYGDFTPAEGVSMAVSWSHDGGKTYGAPLSRSLQKCDRFPVGVNRLGTSTQHGMRLRYSTASAPDFAFLGASVPDPQARPT